MKKEYIKYFAALLLFGSNGVVASYILLTSYEIVLLRSAIGCAVLTGLFFLSGHKVTVLKHKKDLLLIALSGIAMGANWLLLFEAYTRIGVSLSMIIYNYCGPVLVLVLSILLFKEKVTRNKLLALAAASLGAVLISGQATVNGINISGVFIAVLSACTYPALVFFNRMAKHIKGMENAILQLFFTCMTVTVFVWLKQGPSMNIIRDDWLPILWIGLINTGLACYLYFSSIGTLPVQTVAVCGYLEPLSAVLMSVVILHETMLPLQIFGAALIVIGAVLGEKKE